MDEAKLAELTDEIMSRAQRGETLNVDEILSRAPEAREEILRVLSGLQVLKGTSLFGDAVRDIESDDQQAVGDKNLEKGFVLGDYEILEKIGAGGGYIFSPAHDVPKDVPPENMSAMIEVLKNQ